MLVVIEGVDKAGKSTLAERLKRELGWNVVHFGKPGPDPFLEYNTFLDNLTENLICDRFFLGELVYGPLLRKKQSITQKQIKIIESKCNRIGTIIIHANPKYKTISDRFDKLGDDMITESQNATAYIAFKKVFAKTKIVPHLEWLQYAPMDDTVKRILHAIKFLEVTKNDPTNYNIKQYC